MAEFRTVAKPFRGDEIGLGALALEHGVGRDRGRVHDAVDVRRRSPDFGQDVGKSQYDSAAEVIRCRRQLLGKNRAVAAQEHDVGKCAADVDTDPERPPFVHF